MTLFIFCNNGLDAAEILSADDELVTGTFNILWPSALKFKIELLDELSNDNVHICPCKAARV